MKKHHATFHIQEPMRTKQHSRHKESFPSLHTNSASAQVKRLREISGLKIEHFTKIFDISRPTYYKWLSGTPLRDSHREHLLEVLPLIEEAAQRLGGPAATNTWLLTPVSPGGKKPIDYLTAHQYTTFRGSLLHVWTGQKIFQPLAPSHLVHRERPQEEIEDRMERLRPRIWQDDDNDTDSSGLDN